MDIHSSEDCFVIKLFLITGNVKKGDNLIQLYAPGIEQKIDRIEKFVKILAINRRQYSSSRIEMSKSSEFKNLNLDKTIYSDSDKDHFNNIHRMKIGMTTPEAFRATEKIRAQDELNLNKEQLIIDQFDLKNQDSLDKIDSMLEAANSDKQILLDFKERLLIKAPIDGVFNTECMEGFFYKKGQLLANFFQPK